MTLNRADLVAALLAFPGQERGDLGSLGFLIAEAVSLPRDEALDRALFGIFERFPEEDGYGVYWSVLHGLERRGDFEESLLASLRRSPSSFGLRMLNGLRGAGRSECAGVNIMALFEEIASRPDVPMEVREMAAEHAKYERQRGDE